MHEGSHNNPLETKDDFPVRKFIEVYRDVWRYTNNKGEEEHALIHSDNANNETASAQIDRLLENVESGITYESIKSNYEERLENIGLKLTALYNNKEHDKYDDPDGLVISINSISSFLEYIKDHLKLGLNKELAGRLEEINADLNSQIYLLALNTTNVDRGLLIDRMLGLKDFIEAYRELDPTNKYELLDELRITENYLKWFEDQSLKEHIIAQMYKFDIPFESWTDQSPAFWQADFYMEPIEFKDRWEGVLNALYEVKSCEELFNSGLNSLKKSILSARNSINEHLLKQYPENKATYEEFLKILSMAEKALGKLEFEE